MSIASHAKSDFVTVNGVQLQTLDWGGDGPALIFLAGYANTPHFFDALAREFTDRFHVLGLTRRAHGESDQPASGYDIDTLVADIVGFMDVQGIEKATLVGHSFAGMEMATFAAKYPNRLDKLVFLDALYEYEDSDVELFGSDPLPAPSPPLDSFASVADYCEDFVNRYVTYRPLRSARWDELWSLTLEQREDSRFIERIRPETAGKLYESLGSFHANYSAIRCPTLAIFATQTAAWFMPENATPELQQQVTAFAERIKHEYRGRNISRARNEIPDATVIVFEDTSHYCFIDREADVIAAMNAFLC